MNAKKTALLILSVFLGACAQPNYSSDSTLAGGGQGSLNSCSLRLPQSGHCLAWQWEKKPTNEATGSFVLITSSGVLQDPPGRLEIVLWMPSMGHGSTPVTVTRLSQGVYRADEVFFIMPGEWEIRFQWKDGEVIREEAIQKITI